MSISAPALWTCYIENVRLLRFQWGLNFSNILSPSKVFYLWRFAEDNHTQMQWIFLTIVLFSSHVKCIRDFFLLKYSFSFFSEHTYVIAEKIKCFFKKTQLVRFTRPFNLDSRVLFLNAGEVDYNFQKSEARGSVNFFKTKRFLK